MAYHLLPLLVKPAIAGASHALVANGLAASHARMPPGVYRTEGSPTGAGLGGFPANGPAFVGGIGGWLDSPVDEAASQAAAAFEAKVLERMPYILSELRPQLNETAKEAMRAAFADEGLQQAIATTKQDFALALAATAIAAGVISYVLVKYALDHGRHPLRHVLLEAHVRLWASGSRVGRGTLLRHLVGEAEHGGEGRVRPAP